ncbi:phasin family protein [Massilia genomosp. 1]|uniref:Polygranule-associated protein n=1 Tax=Massilia genomosp. 1 TaxID=2609280 RepID=A0ABX0MQG7_9BURK|nr:phasin family protein [Massilia genomosp. 1]NHZ61582.1 polygranule-associated protein [Massilia genomosp. 1]
MTKKLKPQAVEDDSQLADAVRTSAHQIWQAGLGAFAKAQEEGSRVFSKLVQEGNDLQKRTRSMAEDKAGGVAEGAASVAELVARQASGSWDKMEQVFEDRVTRALAGMGVPTRAEVEALAVRVEELSKLVAQLSAQAAPARPVAAKPAPKPAAKRAAGAPAKPAAKAVAKAAAAPRKRAAAKTPAPKGGQGA